jgi:PAP2 superfamily
VSLDMSLSDEKRLSVSRTWTMPTVSELKALAFPHHMLWLAVALPVFMINGMWLLASARFSVEAFWLQSSLQLPMVAFLLMFLRHQWPHRFKGLAHIVWCALMTAMFAGALFPNMSLVNHLTMSLGFAYADAWLHALDLKLGLDWLSYSKAMAANAMVSAFLSACYFQLTNFGLGMVIGLHVLLNDQRRVIEAAFMLFSTALVAMVLSAGFPADGAFVTLADAELKAMLPQGTGAYHMQDMAKLFSGEPVHFVIANMTGLSTFPSFHTCIGVMLIVCSRGRWWSFVPGATVGIGILLATPLYGGHYFVDIMAGIAVFALCFMAHRWLASKGRPLHPQLLKTV